jgi:hypothetical protein
MHEDCVIVYDVHRPGGCPMCEREEERDALVELKAAYERLFNSEG